MVKCSPEQSTKKLISAAMDSHTKIVPPVKSFTLKSSSSDFASRSVNIFSSLSTLENNHQTWMSHNETLESFEDDNTIEPISNTPDVFKKPFAPLPLKRKTVSSRNKRSRKKWIKYSLEDTPLSSDATNSAVAFQFLHELRKKKEEEVSAVSFTDDKLVFCKPMTPKNYTKKNRIIASTCSSSANEEDSNQDFQSSDTVSGQKDKSVTSSVKLMHLEDEFDDAVTDDKLVFCKPMTPKNYTKKNRIIASTCSSSANEEDSDQDFQSSDTVSGQKDKSVTSSVKLMHLEDEFDDA